MVSIDSISVSISSRSLLLATFILVSSSSFPPCHGGDGGRFRYQTQAMQGQGMWDLGGHRVVVFLGARRAVLENDDSGGNTSFILAENRTRRIDPTGGFRHYRGGWNISNRHYFASVGFTAVPLFLISGFWFLGFGSYLLIICLRHGRSKHYVHAKKSNALSLSFLVLFTTATIVGCVVLYSGQGKFYKSTSSTLHYVVNRSDSTVDNLKNVSYHLSTAKQAGVDQYFISSDVQENIDNIQIKINDSATFLEDKTVNNSKGIRRVLKAVKIALISIAAVMLLLAFIGFFSSVLNLHRLVYILATTGWLLVAGTFILCGVFLLLHNVAADTCVAMDEWVKHPTAHTALDDILPCVDNATAQETMHQTKAVTFHLVNVVNKFIANVSNKNYPPQAGPSLSYNQTGPLVPLLCNPYQPNITRRDCQAGEMKFDNAIQEWKKFVCEVSADGICTTPGRVTPKLYNQMSTATSVSAALYNHGPFLVDLQDCSFVRTTFTDIIDHHCPGLRLYSELIFIGLTIVSSAVLLSLTIWVSYIRRRPRQGEENTRQHADMPSQNSVEVQKGIMQR